MKINSSPTPLISTPLISSLVLILTLSLAAQAASFDCGKAATKVERLICSDSAISRLDEELNKAYKTALQAEEQTKAIQQSQKQWLKDRNACSDADCVKRSYEVRLQELSSQSIAAHPPSDNDQATTQKVALQAGTPHYGHCTDVAPAESCGDGHSGKGYKVCETYLESLNSVADVPKCGERVPSGFKRPDWEDVDVMKHLNWAYQIIQEQGRIPSGQNFESWSQTFIEQIKAGQSAPQMRKIQVQQLGGGEVVTLIGYKDDQEGCNRPHDAPIKHRQGGFGYAYFRLLADDQTARLLAFGGENGYVSTRTVSDLLLYAGKPYFVQTWATDYSKPLGVDILGFYLERRLTTKSDQKIYRVKNLYDVKRICKFLPGSP